MVFRLLHAALAHQITLHVRQILGGRCRVQHSPAIYVLLRRQPLREEQ